MGLFYFSIWMQTKWWHDNNFRASGARHKPQQHSGSRPSVCVSLKMEWKTLAEYSLVCQADGCKHERYSNVVLSSYKGHLVHLRHSLPVKRDVHNCHGRSTGTMQNETEVHRELQLDGHRVFVKLSAHLWKGRTNYRRLDGVQTPPGPH